MMTLEVFPVKKWMSKREAVAYRAKLSERWDWRTSDIGKQCKKDVGGTNQKTVRSYFPCKGWWTKAKF